MSEVDSRLMKCFSAVFPTLEPDKIRTASVETLEAWDSLAAVTLLAVVQEEFDVEIDVMELPELDSFEALRNRLGVSGGEADRG